MQGAENLKRSLVLISYFIIMKDKGFTLIELLVVIAIIGILASIVIVSLGGAQDQAKDARITSEMGQLRSKMELIKNEGDGTYSGLDSYCGTAGSYDELNALCNDIAGNCDGCSGFSDGPDIQVKSDGSKY